MFNHCIKALFVCTIFIGWTSASIFYVATVYIQEKAKVVDFEEIDQSELTWDQVEAQLKGFTGRFQNEWVNTPDGPIVLDGPTIVVVVEHSQYDYFKKKQTEEYSALWTFYWTLLSELRSREMPGYPFYERYDKRILLVSDNIVKPALNDNTLDTTRLFFYTLLLKQLHNSKKKKPTIINASQVEDDVLRFFGHKIDVNVKGAVQVVLLHEKNDTWWERY